MHDLLRVQKTSQLLFYFYSALLVTIPIGVAAYWGTLNQHSWGLPRAVSQLTLEQVQPFAPSILVIGFLVSLLPASVLMYGIFQLRKLFRLYSQGSVFTLENSACMRNLSIALLLWTPAHLLFDGLISFVLTKDNTAGNRFISLGIQEPELLALSLGLIFLVISWVMVEACKLHEENAEIV